MDLAHWLLLLWTGVIFYVLGTIWFAQIVVYPLFGKVGAGEYVRSHRFYSSRIPLRSSSLASPAFSSRWRSSFSGRDRCPRG